MKSLGVFNGMDIRINGSDLINLTDMWKAAGSDSSKHPQKWQRLPHAKQFIELLAKKDEWRKSPVIITVRGRGKPQGTYAHWQIALAYAKYLSPEFCTLSSTCGANEIVAESFEEIGERELGIERWGARSAQSPTVNYSGHGGMIHRSKKYGASKKGFASLRLCRGVWMPLPTPIPTTGSDVASGVRGSCRFHKRVSK